RRSLSGADGHVRTRFVGPIQNLYPFRVREKEVGHDDGEYVTAIERPDTRPAVVQAVFTIEPETNVAHTLRAEVANPIIARPIPRYTVPTDIVACQDVAVA